MTSNGPRISLQTLKVLDALMTSGSKLSGAEIGRTTKLASGTLYPILMRLEQEGWLQSQWETEDPHVLRRPRKRLYHVTALGARKARAAAAELQPMFGGLQWA
jgi:PadR family transcriptional regulator PadR